LHEDSRPGAKTGAREAAARRARAIARRPSARATAAAKHPPTAPAENGQGARATAAAEPLEQKPRHEAEQRSACQGWPRTVRSGSEGTRSGEGEAGSGLSGQRGARNGSQDSRPEVGGEGKREEGRGGAGGCRLPNGRRRPLPKLTWRVGVGGSEGRPRVAWESDVGGLGCCNFRSSISSLFAQFYCGSMGNGSNDFPKYLRSEQTLNLVKFHILTETFFPRSHTKTSNLLKKAGFPTTFFRNPTF
jgi:hypothetical protein